MKCYTVNGKGLDGLRPEERPSPGAPGPGEVLVEVHSVSLNYRDLLVASGKYGGLPDEPFVPVSDMAGVVLAAGPGVKDIRPGDRVVNAPLRVWPAGTLRASWARTSVGTFGLDGVLTEEMLYPAMSLVRLPDSLSLEEGSTLTVAGLTAWAAVVTHGRARPGDWVLAHGTGGVAIFAAQICRLLGARAILTTSSEEKAAVVRSRFGVEHTLDYRDEEWPVRVRELTGGPGADIVVDTAGGETLARSIRACGYGGRVAVVGVLAGLESRVSIPDLIYRQVSVRGIFMESAEELRALVRALEGAGIRPCIDRVFGFDEARAAYEHLASGGHIGKVVIRLRS